MKPSQISFDLMIGASYCFVPQIGVSTNNRACHLDDHYISCKSCNVHHCNQVAPDNVSTAFDSPQPHKSRIYAHYSGESIRTHYTNRSCQNLYSSYRVDAVYLKVRIPFLPPRGERGAHLYVHLLLFAINKVRLGQSYHL
jgi:hypothetical protein